MTIPKYFLVLASLICLAQAKSIDQHDVKAECSISINGDLPNPQPLLLKPGGSNDGYGFYLPADSKGQVLVDQDGEIRLSCSGTGNYLKPLGSSVSEAIAVCVGGTSFKVGSRTFSFRELYCNTNPFHTARVSPSGAKCGSDGKSIIIEIGFIVGSEFFKTMDICFDQTEKNSLWSKFQLVSGIGGYQSGFPSPDTFSADTFYTGINPANQYTRNGQRATVSKILGSTTLGNKYISQSDDYFMSRGHLTAKADFVYGSQHRATYHYINVAPQWQTFNGGNWNRMEQDLRLYTGKNALDLIVYTGTYGVTTLPDINNVEKEIWLSVDSNNNRAIPTPKLFWRVVSNPETEQAIAFVGVNNPYIPRPQDDQSYIICKDVCDQVSWLQWKPTDIRLGYSYCCEVNAEFRAKVSALPEFNVSGLLT